MLQLEVVDTLVDFVAEQIVEDAICRRDYHVSVLELLYVLLRMLRQVLAHVAVALGPQDCAKLLELLNATFLFEYRELLLAWKDRKLVRNVE